MSGATGRALRAHWKILVFLGAIGVGTHNGLAYLGLNYTTATNGVILNSFIPVMIVTMSWVFLRERLLPLQVAGVAVSLAGVLTILSDGSLATLLAFRLNVGDLFIILSMAMWSVYTIALRWRPGGLCTSCRSCSWSRSSATRACCRSGWARWRSGDHVALVVGVPVGAMLAVSLFSSVLAYLFWNRGVDEVGANVAGLFVHLMPVFGIVLAWVFLGERLAPFHVVGIALILTGIWITSRYQRRRPDVEEAAAVGTD